MLGINLGLRVAYFYTPLAFEIRAFVIFPILVIPPLYFLFLYKKNIRGKEQTVWRVYLENLASKGQKQNIYSIVLGLVALSLFSGIIAWSSIFIAACVAELAAHLPFSQTYTITEITTRRMRPRVFDLSLAKNSTEIDGTILRLTRQRYEEHYWKVGDVICVHGRTSIFGSVADTLTKGDCGSLLGPAPTRKNQRGQSDPDLWSPRSF